MRLPRLLGLIGLAGIATAPVARAEDPKPKLINYSILLDTYVQKSGQQAPGGTTLPSRSFDQTHDVFRLGLAELNIWKAATDKSPIGAKVTLTAGQTANLVHVTEPGYQKTQRMFQQAYLTYLLNTKKPITIDFGKFVTHMGLEVIEPGLNDNYSRGLLFNYAIPLYHTGFRISAPISKTINGQLFIVNGWNDFKDDNDSQSFGFQLNYNPNPAWTWYLNYLGGKESTAAGLVGDTDLHTFDLIGQWTLNPKWKLAFNADYADASNNSNASGHWSGIAAYAKYTINPVHAVTVRAEKFSDTNGIRTGSVQEINEITATWEAILNPNFTLRLEYRHDHAGVAFYPTSTGVSKNQDTLTLSQLFKF